MVCPYGVDYLLDSRVAHGRFMFVLERFLAGESPTSFVLSGEKSKGRTLGVCALLLAVLMSLSTVLPAASTAAAAPAVGDYFEYDYNSYVDHGTGTYYGYTDKMLSSSRYVVSEVSGDVVTFKATGSWTFQGSDGGYDSGILDQNVSFSMTTRRYVGPIDVDGSYIDPAIWFWIPTDVKKGQSIRILDDEFKVASTSKTIWIGMVPHKVIQLTASGSYARDDAYGMFQATYDDSYCFDKETGYIVSEEYVEHDSTGSASFRYVAHVDVTSSSYSTPVDWLTISIVYILVPVIIVLVVLLVLRWRRGPSRIKVNTVSGEKEAEIKRIRRASELDSLTPGGSRHFTPFLRVFGKRAVSEGDPVVVASSKDSMIGMAMLDRESALGSVFALDEQVAICLIRRLRLRDFFLEEDGHVWDFPPAQQIDTFDIMELKNPRPVPYDNTHVRAMRHEDVKEVTSIAEDVYKGPASIWVRSCFEGGDIAYVAEDSGRVVGFGFATMSGSKARLHSLTMLPSYRASGYGSELMAARLTVLSALRVDSVIVEISKHNDASLAVARNAGFQKIGETIYYSSRSAKLETVSQRRF